MKISQRAPVLFASIERTTACEPNCAASSEISSGRSTAAVFTVTLSAPARSTACPSSRLRMPPPAVNGMFNCSRDASELFQETWRARRAKR